MGKDLKSLISNCVHIHRHDGDLYKLKNATDDLKALRDSILKRIKVSEPKRSEKARVWITQAENVIREAEDLMSQQSSKTGHKLDKKVSKQLRTVMEMKAKAVLGDAEENDRLSTVDEEQTLGLEPVSGQVWRCLTVESSGIIGLYGVEGVGKTAVLMNVNNKLLQHKSNGFDFVIWVLVSKNPNPDRMQDAIMEKIGFLDKTWTSKKQEEKAAMIFDILGKKRFALFFDDVWEKIDLGKLGVPIPNAQNGSKIVFTTCSEDVCREMGAQTKIKLLKLQWDKSWDLFRKNVGEETLKSHPDIATAAEEVARKCDGLPLALVTIGRAMASKKTPQEWRDALYVLSNSTSNFSVLKLLDRN